MSTFEALHHWHHTKTGLLVVGCLELLVAYAVILRAFDSGNLWEYLITLIFLVGGLRNLTQLIGKLLSGGKPKQTTKA